MIWIGAIVGGLGLASVLLRKSLLGVYVGIQILFLGATLTLVVTGLASRIWLESHVFGLLVVISGVVQLAVGYVLAIRLFYLKRKTDLDQVRSLRH